MVMPIFDGAYQGLRVLITGHTGFKGSWLTQWLLLQGAHVIGVSLEPPTQPNMFSLLNIASRCTHKITDIRNAEALREFFCEQSPQIVFHLAAQPLVRHSYTDPKLTWDTNLGGTVNVLEAIRHTPSVRACVVATSDKCYENREWVWGYRENEAMGGHDPYSASKGAVELAVASYRRSFFNTSNSCKLASARAGNVIGGGDWATDRIVTDIVKSIVTQSPIRLRNPHAVRPWQHVLEPLSGYLLLGSKLLSKDAEQYASAWNFGPSDASVATVYELAKQMTSAWGQGVIHTDTTPQQPHEAGLLKLDSSKAHSILQWRSIWNLEEAVRATVGWYKSHAQTEQLLEATCKDILAYVANAKQIGVAWAAKNSHEQSVHI
jgi:CDP-glucose 4,6-dehydratase